MRTIRVTGRGQIKVKPDATRITLTLEETYPEYGEALRHSSIDTQSIRDTLSAFGFERSDLKTLSFNVDPEYEHTVSRKRCAKCVKMRTS
ncbi:MAG: SIMPL domain-containing protein, partial [Coriobacteriales bacterium]|nr:SIMPL domain-containing protein [Coriobacteriales bacterium]